MHISPNKSLVHDTIIYIIIGSNNQTMPKRLIKADQRNRFRLLAKRQHISVAELKNRLKSGGDGEDPVLPLEDIIVSCETSSGNQNSHDCPKADVLASALDTEEEANVSRGEEFVHTRGDG